jgi:hypothetical protein
LNSRIVPIRATPSDTAAAIAAWDGSADKISHSSVV